MIVKCCHFSNGSFKKPYISQPYNGAVVLLLLPFPAASLPCSVRQILNSCQTAKNDWILDFQVSMESSHRDAAGGGQGVGMGTKAKNGMGDIHGAKMPRVYKLKLKDLMYTHGSKGSNVGTQ